MILNDYYSARDIIDDLLRKELCGPISEDEVIRFAWPDEFYICGKLYPQNTQVSQEEIEYYGTSDGDEEDYEVPINLCYSNRPSSMAMTFTVRPGVKKLTGEVSFAWYVPEEPEEIDKKYSLHKNWRRHTETLPVEINLDTEQQCQVVSLKQGLELHTYHHKVLRDGMRTITLALVNTAKQHMDRLSNCASTWFQPRIVVKGTDIDPEPFVARNFNSGSRQDMELLNLEMLYRYNRVFATGHGCSVDWKSSGDFASEIWTEIIPSVDVRQMEPARYIREDLLTFSFLAEGSAEDVSAGLRGLADSYEKWIDEKESSIKNLPDIYHEVALKNITACRESLERIRAGIALLESDILVWKAFQLTNQAMLLHRTRKAQEHKPGEGPGWYPFQLAFILQEIGSIANHDDPYRDIVDLLWFPTGGGKTEAYLGLAVFTIFLRRLRSMQEKKPEGGVTIIMRYTLRLLTLQQFERAASLLCACELIRRENSETLGQTEIATGLWVGGHLTPNTRKEAASVLGKIRTTGYESLTEEEPDPCQVRTCPWCSTPVKPQDYSVENYRMAIYCPNKECPFHGGLPLYLVDEDIYERGPALVISTVDKYARMAWEPKVGRLFGIGTDWSPPELIIQDELHLIAGPLGTIAGLYETAIEELCQYHGRKVKIISSTATIRNASGQILSLYGRECRQFPPQGLDIRDSYFALESSPESRPTRRYLGIIAPGTSGNTLLIRVYSLLLMAREYLVQEGFSEQVIDSYWTLTGYFNTLKQLGGAQVNIYDDVMARLKYLYETKFKMLFPGDSKPPDDLNLAELTSRKRSSEIGEVLKGLERAYPDPDCYDVILSSSMLSVGVDIGRLGLMIVQGQPKSTSEYVQATSRVGRRTPGLVITMYDASRSRDISHYERFRAYHSSIYRYVEATSLTPFAERARDRALHAVFISLCRHMIHGLLKNEEARNIIENRPRAEAIIDKIVSRVDRVDPQEADGVSRELKKILEFWESRAKEDLVYQVQSSARRPARPLLVDRFSDDIEAFPTLNSMRDVDVECEIYLRG